MYEAHVNLITPRPPDVPRATAGCMPLRDRARAAATSTPRRPEPCAQIPRATGGEARGRFPRSSSTTFSRKNSRPRRSWPRPRADRLRRAARRPRRRLSAKRDTDAVDVAGSASRSMPGRSTPDDADRPRAGHRGPCRPTHRRRLGRSGSATHRPTRADPAQRPLLPVPAPTCGPEQIWLTPPSRGSSRCRGVLAQARPTSIRRWRIRLIVERGVGSAKAGARYVARPARRRGGHDAQRRAPRAQAGAVAGDAFDGLAPLTREARRARRAAPGSTARSAIQPAAAGTRGAALRRARAARAWARPSTTGWTQRWRELAQTITRHAPTGTPCSRRPTTTTRATEEEMRARYADWTERSRDFLADTGLVTLPDGRALPGRAVARLPAAADRASRPTSARRRSATR